MLKRAASLATTMVMLAAVSLSLVSCAAYSSTGSAAKETGRTVLTVMAPLHFPNTPDAGVIDKLEELTGTRLSIEWVRDEIYTDKMNTALTTNSLKKATFAKYTDYILMKNSIRSGAFWEIGPYLDEYPNLRRLDPDILKQTAVDGEIYGLYTERPSSRQGIILREDWLENLGLEIPKTIDELYEVMRQFTYGDPDRNGKDDTIGLTDRDDLVFGAFKTLSSYFGAPNDWAVEGRSFVPEFETKPYMDTMNFMKKLYDEKIVNPDFAITSKDVQRNLLIRGKAGVYIGSMSDAQRLSSEAKRVDPDARFTLANRIEGPDGYKVWSIPNFNGLYLFSKTAIRTEEELREVLRFFDRTMDPDVATLMRYGIEGRHYELEGEQIYLPEESSQLRVDEVASLYTLMIADLSNPNVKKVVSQEELSELADRLIEDNEKFIVRSPSVGLESPYYDQYGAELYKIVTDATYNYILGGLDEEGFRKEIAKWRANGGDRIISEYEQAYFR
ncbi:extracellular solute-binding protein [Cohnella thailandensis]|uniref:Extracellular solute-binding protein n=1 Tax=Cohnella thailandensis TaxID=557557 RepID=A0A841T1D3_9BACL|nr:extracellular solute-binding protein [Cohnella thailandensis]MBB6634881.1 extracellular solute-binding protein [Cohnella thailandensis]MBP1975897.1 putative aldouronate transport system substrate-binding protein [Cohnella thailandensis]